MARAGWVAWRDSWFAWSRGWAVWLAGKLGLVLVSQHNAELSAKAEAEGHLLHALRNLQQQLAYRGVLEREIAIMRDLAKSRNQQDIDTAVGRMDAVCAELRNLMPAQYRQVPVPAPPDGLPVPESLARRDADAKKA